MWHALRSYHQPRNYDLRNKANTLLPTPSGPGKSVPINHQRYSQFIITVQQLGYCTAREHLHIFNESQLLALHVFYLAGLPNSTQPRWLFVAILFALIHAICVLPHKPDTKGSSSFVSFTTFSPTCGRITLSALTLWPGRQPYMPCLVGGRRGGGPSSVATHSRNPLTEHRRDSPISSSLFSHGPAQCAVG